jgi:hypothetical protein
MNQYCENIIMNNNRFLKQSKTTLLQSDEYNNQSDPNLIKTSASDARNYKNKYEK